MAINPQILALHRLQKEDRRLASIERKLGNIPKRLKEMDTDYEKLSKMLDAEVGKLEDSRAFRRDQQMQLEDEEHHISQSKARLNQIKTNRELNATQREIETTRRMATARQDELGKISAAIADAEQRIEGMKKALDELGEAFKAEREKLEASKSKLDKRMEKARKSRELLTKDVEEKLLRDYERIRKTRSGIAFVPARERRCLACEMKVPHSHYVSLRRGDEIIDCENCGRLLYWIGHFPEEKEKIDAARREAEAKAS